jgi:hypothetical protein
MSLRERLQALGQRLGVLQSTPSLTEAPAKISTHVVKLDDLISGIPLLDIRGASETRVDLPIGFDGILTAAGVHTPEHGWTVQKLIDVLRSEGVRKLTREEAQRRVLSALAQDKAPTEDVVRDAVARDQALDAFERFAKEKLGAQRERRQERLKAGEEQLQALQRELDRIRREQKQEELDWNAWRKSKTDYEKDMAWALSFIMEKPLITIDDEK